MSFVRKVLSIYRRIQCKVCGRAEYGIMPSGIQCTHTSFEEEINHGDVVHPCVRYIPVGYLGHKWWMVYTPYYASNDTKENPILCYGANDTVGPPTHWIVKYQVQGQPSKGYNSDPTLLYDKDKLYVMWRENLTERCDKAGYVRATFGAVVKDNGLGEVFGPLVSTNDSEIDKEVSPTFIRTNSESYTCLAMHLKFHSRRISNMSDNKRRIMRKITNVLDVSGIWSEQKGYGIACWKSSSIKAPFKYIHTLKFSNCNKLYRPWHMDIFEWQNKYYAIVQSNQCNADICLAESLDGTNFKLFWKPLMTNKTCGKIGLYKPTAGVVDGLFYLYYTAQDPENRALNKLYLTTMSMEDMMPLL